MSFGRSHIEVSDDEDEFADIPVTKQEPQALSWVQRMMLQDGGDSPRVERYQKSDEASNDTTKAPMSSSSLPPSYSNGDSVGKVSSLSEAFARNAETNNPRKATSTFPAHAYAPSSYADVQNKRPYSNWASGNHAPPSKIRKSRPAPRERGNIVDEMPSEEEEEEADEEETEEEEDEIDLSDEDDGARDDDSDDFDDDLNAGFDDGATTFDDVEDEPVIDDYDDDDFDDDEPVWS